MNAKKIIALIALFLAAGCAQRAPYGGTFTAVEQGEWAAQNAANAEKSAYENFYEVK